MPLIHQHKGLQTSLYPPPSNNACTQLKVLYCQTRATGSESTVLKRAHLWYSGYYIRRAIITSRVMGTIGYKRRRARHTQPQPHLSVRDIPFLEREPPTGDEVQDTGPYWSAGHDVHCLR